MYTRLKTCTNYTKRQDVENSSDSVLIDRITALPVELLIKILSLLPTKDVAATCVSCKTMIHVFPWITSLDFDDSPISYCLEQPYALERYPGFVTFVDSVLHAHRSEYLTRFRLGVGPQLKDPYRWSPKHTSELCELGCFPDLKSTKINAWITSSLARCGLRELDLRISVREEGYAQLPSEIFTCETLEVLKLEVNLGLDRVANMSSFRLPNLKLAVLAVAIIPDDGLLTRFVSSCPKLEDLTVKARWKDGRFISISSPSLQRLALYVCNELFQFHKSDFVLIHTPNLKYLEYVDELASHYSITPMKWLVEAKIYFGCMVREEDEDFGPPFLSLMRPLSNVQHLALNPDCMEELHHDEVLNQLPWFHNLKTLELNGIDCWEKVLLAFLYCSPVLETLISEGSIEVVMLDEAFCSIYLPNVPPCCKYHLKRVVIKWVWGIEREIDLIQFLLRHALVLEELVIFRSILAVSDPTTFERTLQNLPRASITSSIHIVSVR